LRKCKVGIILTLMNHLTSKPIWRPIRNLRNSCRASLNNSMFSLIGTPQKSLFKLLHKHPIIKISNRVLVVLAILEMVVWTNSNSLFLDTMNKPVRLWSRCTKIVLRCERLIILRIFLMMMMHQQKARACFRLKM